LFSRSIILAASSLALALTVTPAKPQEKMQEKSLTPMAEPADDGMAQTGNGDPAAVDTETVTGAVMTEKDMLQYCVNIADSARETRYAIIQSKLDEKQAKIEKKLASLNEKMNAIREYVEIREKFRAAAEKQVVTIYESMRPDAAASQLSVLDTGLAASIIMKLSPKVSSKILTEMPPKQAAQIANYLTAAMQPPNKERAGQ
jgi:flagellar motility protein MotE (MotC chaperone)